MEQPKPTTSSADALSKMGEEVVKSTNCQHLPIKAGAWVRVRPPNDYDIETIQMDDRWLKFNRVGMRVEVLGDLEHNAIWIDVLCGGDRIAWDQQEFRKTFVRLVEGDEYRDRVGAPLLNLTKKPPCEAL